MKALFVAVLVFALSVPALAKRDRALLDGALNDALKEKDQVQRSYKKNDERREKPAPKEEDNRRIKLEVGDEFGSDGGGSDGDDSSLKFRGNRAEEDVNVDLDREMTDINEAASKEASRKPTAAAKGAQKPVMQNAAAPAAQPGADIED